jgi:hypothetical protein
MAISVTNAQDYVQFGTTPVSGTGARTVIWRVLTSDTNDRYMWGWEGGAASGSKYQCRLDTQRPRLECQGAAWIATNTITDGAWHTIAYATPANDDLTNTVCYIDGSSETRANSGTVTINTETDENWALGNTPTAPSSSILTCYLAEYAVWDVELTADELAIATGENYSPEFFRRASLVTYVRGIRDDYADIIANDVGVPTSAGTGVGTAPHPPVIYPSSRSIFAPAAAAAAGAPYPRTPSFNLLGVSG